MSDCPVSWDLNEGGWVPRLNLQHHPGFSPQPATVPPPTAHTAQSSFAFYSKHTLELAISTTATYTEQAANVCRSRIVGPPLRSTVVSTNDSPANRGASCVTGYCKGHKHIPLRCLWYRSGRYPLRHPTHTRTASSSRMMNDKLHIHTCTHPTVIYHTAVEPPLQRRRVRRTAANRTAISKSSLHSLHRATTAKHSTPWRRVSLCAERGPGLVAPPLHSFKVVLSLLLFSR
jgi:hypothetical protein